MKKLIFTLSVSLTFFVFDIIHGQQDMVLRLNSVPACSSQFLNDFEFIRLKTQGLSVRNPTNNEIGYKIAADFFPIADDVYWYPVNGKKMVLNGLLQDFFIHDDDTWATVDGDEYDWNIRIVPDEDFKFLLTQIPPAENFDRDKVNTKVCVVNGVNVQCMYAEVTPDQSLYVNEWFPQTGPTPLLGRNVCVYGAWVRDSDHEYWPEIHPIEAIWWNTPDVNPKTNYFHVICIQDDSNRFDVEEDFMNSGPGSTGHRPWSDPPISTEIRIPFEYDYKYKDHLVINIEEIKAHNVITSSEHNMTDSDDGTQHRLVYPKTRRQELTANSADNVLIEVNENISDGSNLIVQFDDIFRKPDNHIVGYLKITTAFGKNSNGDEGYHILRITQHQPSNRVNRGQVLRPDRHR